MVEVIPPGHIVSVLLSERVEPNTIGTTDVSADGG
jgi:hypothetical protein